MMFVSEECNLAAVPQFQKSRRTYIYSKDSATLHTELPPARKGKEDWMKDISLVPIDVPLWFIGYLIVCGQLRLRDIYFGTETIEEMVGRELGLKEMRTIDVLSHLLGFEAVYPGLSTCQWRDIRLDAVGVVDYGGTVKNYGQLDRFIALNPATLTIGLRLGKCTWLQGDDGQRVTSERLQEMRVDTFRDYDFHADKCDKLLDYLVTAAPNLRSLTVCAYIDESPANSEEEKGVVTRIQEALETMRDSIFPKLECVMGKEAVVEFELVAVMCMGEVGDFLAGDSELLRFGAPAEKEGFDYSRSLAIVRGEGLPDWYLSYDIREIWWD